MSKSNKLPKRRKRTSPMTVGDQRVVPLTIGGDKVSPLTVDDSRVSPLTVGDDRVVPLTNGDEDFLDEYERERMSKNPAFKELVRQAEERRQNGKR